MRLWRRAPFLSSRAEPGGRPADGGAPPVAILLYVNRSGSTLLSRLLSEAAEGLFVFPELGFPVALLLARRLGRALAGDRLLALILRDPRRDALPLSDAALAAICAEPETAALDVLLARIAAACLGRPPRAVLLKLESLLWLAGDIEASVARPVFLHLVRDPRAVASSLLRTPVPEKPGFFMGRGSAWYAARHWRDYQRGVAALARRRQVTTLRYEALHDVAGETCAQALAAFGMRLSAAEAGRYRIGAIDAALHPRVFEAPDPGRSEAWRAELPHPARRIVELLCRQEMIRAGYDPGPPPTAHDRALLRRARAAHWLATVRHAWRTALAYVRRDGAASLARRGLLLLGQRAARRRA